MNQSGIVVIFSNCHSHFIATMFEEEDFILSISTQDGIPIPEDNVTFSQQAYDKDTALFDFDTQIFEDFLDDSLYFQFEDDAILDFTD